MYQNYFGLKEQAFSIAVNPRYLFMSQQHKEALAHLIYGVSEGGFVMLTGEVGTGKTTIIRCLLEQLPKNTEIAIILNPMANIRELLSTICDEFGITYNAEKTSIKQLTDLIHKHLLVNHTRGKNTVLLIDEAQLLSAEVLEQIRLLTNLETATQKLLQIVLVGQPELNVLLSQPRLRQLSQRITARFHLTPLDLQETDQYIRHRLVVAGLPEGRNPFTPSIIKQIHRFTGGIPRMINILCERTLIGAYGHNKPVVDKQIFNLAKREVEGNRQSNVATQSQPPYLMYVGLSLSSIVGVGIILLLLQLIAGPNENTTPVVSPLVQASPNVQEEPPQLVANASAVDVPDNATPARAMTLITGTAKPAYDIEDLVSAQALLFDYLQFPTRPDTHPCWQINTRGHQCGKAVFSTWDDITAVNRPMVLSIIKANKTRSHVVLIGLQDDFALLLDETRNRSVVGLHTLGPQWTGEVFYAWKTPEKYSEPLGLGDSGEGVAEVAAQFALLDSQTQPLTSRRFNRALQERVKLFQREHNLQADGILGERTLMKLNETLGLSTTLEREFL